jgi:hypothetical protein
MALIVEQWSPTASLNTDPPPNGAPEGMDADTVNDTMRQMMASQREIYDGLISLLANMSGGADLETPDPLLSMAWQAAGAVAITGGTVNGVTINATSVKDDGSQIHALRDGIVAPVDLTSLANYDFTGIRSDASELILTLRDVVLTGGLLVQLGTSGGIVTSGYVSTGGYYNNSGIQQVNNFSSGFTLMGDGSAATFTGRVAINLADVANNIWHAGWMVKHKSASVTGGGGYKNLSGVLTQLRVIPTSGSFTSGYAGLIVK